ncbi:MAG: carboxypeptidase regulatory-like domain-containing protein [Gemmatimonadaceae bacterium]
MSTRLALLIGSCLLLSGEIGAQGARLSGTVVDLRTHRPVTGASVQVLRSDSSGSTFSRDMATGTDGAYAFTDLPAGTYTVGFFHPSVDSLGIDLPIRSVELSSTDAARLDLSIPAHEELIARLCGKDAATDSSAAVVGFVRDVVTSAPVPGAVVLLEWGEWVLRGASMREENQHLSTATRRDGWYAFCNVPVGWMMQLRAATDVDTTGVIDPGLVGKHVVVRDLYLGPTTRQERLPPDSLIGSSTVAAPQVVWSGPARLVGIVRRADGRGLKGARVSVAGTAAAGETNTAGEYALSSLPSGSQTLVVRAIGYVPMRQVLDLRPDSVTRVSVIELTNLRSYLDTVRVTATRIFSSDPNGFESRQRAHIGHFVDRAALDRLSLNNPSDAIRMLPGVTIVPAAIGSFGRTVLMKSPFGNSVCIPTLYVDGFSYKAGEVQLDDLLNPDQIEGIEVYTRQSQAPVQFTNTMSGCGSIVVWTRQTPRARKKD